MHCDWHEMRSPVSTHLHMVYTYEVLNVDLFDRIVLEVFPMWLAIVAAMRHSEEIAGPGRDYHDRSLLEATHLAGRWRQVDEERQFLLPV